MRYLRKNYLSKLSEQIFNMNKKIIWVEKLCFWDAGILIVRSFFTKFTVYYNTNNEKPISAAAEYMIKYAGMLTHRLDFSPVDLSLQKSGDNSSTLVYQTYENLNLCLEQFCKRRLQDETESFKNMVKCYLSFFLYKRVAFITMVKEEIDSSEILKTQKHTLFFRSHPLNGAFLSFFVNEKFGIKEYPGWVESAKYRLLPLYYFMLVLISKLTFKKKIRSNISSIKPAVWVEYGRPLPVNLAFWLPEVKDKADCNNFDIVYYLDRRDDKAMPMETTNLIESRGLKWIDAHNLSLAKMTSFNSSILKKMLMELWSDLPGWYRVFRLQYAFWFFVYTSIFEQFRVKILIQYQEVCWRQEVQTRAIEAVKGITLGYHWSHYQCNVTPTHLFPYHVYFVWGKLIHSCLRQGGNIHNFILPCGVWTNARGDIEGKNKFPDTINFVILVLDSSVLYSDYQTPDSLSDFYLRIIRLLENHHSWGAIIKSKMWDINGFSCLPSGNEIVRRLQLLLKQGRVIVLNPSVSIVSAAHHADLTVCYGLNSAGIICATYGYKTIHWDCTGWLRHQFYKDQNQQFIYSDLDTLEKAILDVSQGRKELIGDFSAWSGQFNYFGDFKAPQRVGRFIKQFMSEIMRTEDLKQSLDSTVKIYLQENKVGDDFFAEMEKCLN